MKKKMRAPPGPTIDLEIDRWTIRRMNGVDGEPWNAGIHRVQENGLLKIYNLTVRPFSFNEDRRTAFYDSAWKHKEPSDICMAFTLATYWEEEDRLIAAEPKADDLTDAFRQGFQDAFKMTHPEHVGPSPLRAFSPVLKKAQEIAGQLVATSEGKLEFQPVEAKPDVCRYAKPVPIELPAVKDPDGHELSPAGPVSCEVPESARPNARNDYRRGLGRIEQQVIEGMDQITAEFQAEGRSRIMRLADWPYCSHTQRNVSIAWVNGLAHWQCDDCAGFGKPREEDPLTITFNDRLPRLVWVDSHLELKP